VKIMPKIRRTIFVEEDVDNAIGILAAEERTKTSYSEMVQCLLATHIDVEEILDEGFNADNAKQASKEDGE
jgi:hypothetical protein